MIYKERLKNLRLNKDLSQEKVANIIGVGKKAYNHFETEYTIIPIKHLNTLSNYYNVSLDYLFGFNDIKNYASTIEDIDLDVMANRLKIFRKDNNITQEKLADYLGAVKGTIGNYESGRALIATRFLYEICKEYKISADYLLGRIEQPRYLK